MLLGRTGVSAELLVSCGPLLGRLRPSVLGLRLEDPAGAPGSGRGRGDPTTPSARKCKEQSDSHRDNCRVCSGANISISLSSFLIRRFPSLSSTRNGTRGRQTGRGKKKRKRNEKRNEQEGKGGFTACPLTGKPRFQCSCECQNRAKAQFETYPNGCVTRGRGGHQFSFPGTRDAPIPMGDLQAESIAGTHRCKVLHPPARLPDREREREVRQLGLGR